MPTTTITIDVTDVSTTQQLPLGHIYVQPAQVGAGSVDDAGEKEWVYVFNDEAATAFAVGDIIVRDPSATTESVFGGLIAASGTVFAAHAILGVAQHAIAAGSYGFIQRKGKCLVKNGTGDITADSAIVSGGDRAGAAKTGTIGTDDGGFFGFALEAEATNNTTFDAYINCPGS